MLFRKKIQPCCDYCAHGAALEEGRILCSKKGIIPEGGKCRRFQYDPCKRIPPKAKALDFSKYEGDDFSL